MNIDGIHSRWGRIAAAAGALALGTVGLVGVSTAATAASGPGQDNAPTEGSLTIHKYAGSTTSQTNDGTELTPGPNRPALQGVQFTIEEVTAIGGTAIDLETPAGWDYVAGLGNTVPLASGMTLGTPVVVTTDVNGATPTQTLDVGLYYVTETASGPNDIAAPAQPFLVSIPQPQGVDGWLYDVHVYPKNTLNASVATKTVDDSGAVKIGDAVSWTITTPAFSAHDGGTINNFVVRDDLVDQLNFVANSVTAAVHAGATSTPIAAADFGNYFTVAYSTPGVAGGVLTISATAAGHDYINSLPTSQKLSFTLSTTVVAVGDIANEATVNFGVGTSDFGTANVNTQWGPALITKRDAADNAPLLGAEFDLYVAGANGAQILDEDYLVREGITTDANGEAFIEGLKVGTYWLVETKAPVGYVLPEDQDAWSNTFDVVVVADPADAVTVDITNTQQSVPNLPMTGANGQLLMTIAGIALILVAGGGALAMRNRSKSAE